MQVPLPACPACGGWLREPREHEHFQVDLPEITPLWRRFVTQSGYCEHCRRRVHSRHPEQISEATGAAGVSVGPRAKARAADLRHRLGLSERVYEGAHCGLVLDRDIPRGPEPPPARTLPEGPDSPSASGPGSRRAA